MPSGNRIVDFFADALRQGASSHVEAAFNDGFNAAANVSIDTVTESIDALVARIKNVGPLSDAEQLLLAGLMSLKADIDDRLRHYSESSSTEVSDSMDRH